MISPAFKYHGGLNPRPTPKGVPVEIISPGSKVINCDKYEIKNGILKIMSLVLEFCNFSPFTVNHKFKCWGSFISSFVARKGPSGANVSQLFPLTHWPLCSIWNALSE